MSLKDTSHLFKERLLKKCPANCDNGGVRSHNNFTSCVVCEGLSLVDAETGKGFPPEEVARQLLWKLLAEKQLTQALRKENAELKKKVPYENPVYPKGSRHE